VVRVYKNTSPIAISAPQSITVARTGGSLTVGYLKLVAKDGNFPDFQLQHTYLLALKTLADTNSFFGEELREFRWYRFQGHAPGRRE
jgi:hypothetical protein